ncbi:hypothetical protein AN958_03605 [Leucoagaricus sp. SymC.cos]|nr:hypothetical protein AN958_03605 [Leucoagaricus sp. SymC.cos]
MIQEKRAQLEAEERARGLEELRSEFARKREKLSGLSESELEQESSEPEQPVPERVRSPSPLPPPSIHDIQGGLPIEVLNQIFSIYTDLLRESNTDVHSNQAIPWILGKICHSWRQVAIYSPLCWNTFTIQITEDSDISVPSEMHQTLLSRTRAAPLHIFFDFSQYHEPIPGDPLPIIQPLVDRSSQWAAVLMRGVDVPEIYRQFRSIRGRIPDLRSLKIYFRNRPSRGSIPLPGEHAIRNFDLFSDAPSLTQVLLNDMFSNGLPSYDIVLPWNQITSYGAYNVPGKPFPNELDRQPNLRSLTTIYDDFPYLPPKHFSHQTLRELYVNTTTDPDGCFKQMTRLTLPSLELLVITFMTMELRQKTSAISAIITLITNSQCQLKSLAISQNCDLHIAKLPELFALTPELETLDVGHGTYFRDALAALRFDPEKSTLLPNLKRLVVVYTISTKPIDMKLISELVESRKRVSADLSYIGELLNPLPHVRVHIKRSETRYYCFHDLEGTYNTPPGQDPDTYSLKHDADPEFEFKIMKAMDELESLLDSRTKTSESETVSIVAKYHEVEKLYRAHVLCSTASNLFPGDKEGEIITKLRALCNEYIPAEYLRQRSWMMANPNNLFYLHPDHEARRTTQQADIVIGTKFPPASAFEGYGYWFNADIDRQMENSRPYIC